MLEWILGLAAFAMFFLYDWNRGFWKLRWMTPMFAVGNVCLAAVGTRLIWMAFRSRTGAWYLWLAIAAACLWGLVYTLYFALPFDDTYRREADGHKVCRTGMYGRCRHPGIWWFFGCFVCLGLSTGEGSMVVLCLALSLCNLLYAWYQDRFIFVIEFSDYEDYRKAVPFLIPKMKGR